MDGRAKTAGIIVYSEEPAMPAQPQCARQHENAIPGSPRQHASWAPQVPPASRARIPGVCRFDLVFKRTATAPARTEVAMSASLEHDRLQWVDVTMATAPSAGAR